MFHPVERQEYSIEKALELRRSPAEIILKRQAEFLKEHLLQAVRATFYRESILEAGVDIDGVSHTLDLSSLPLTSREAIELNPEAFCIPLGQGSDIVDISQTSGTTGKALSVPFTRNDILRLGFNEALAFYGAGIRTGQRVLLQVTLDRCFIAGLAYFAGCTHLGAAAVRCGPGAPALQWQVMKDTNPHAVVGVPAHLASVARWAKERGHDIKGIGIEKIIAIGEPVRRSDLSLLPLGEEIRSSYGCTPVSTYAATEIQTCFCECEQGQGGHLHPELALVEILDEDGNRVPDGKPGEVVVTPLGVEAMPLVRYRTGDIARLFTEPCQCGWNTPRLGPVEARLSQRLKCRGTTIYPEMIFQALQDVPQVRAAYIEVREEFDLSDHVTVVAGAAEMAESLLEDVRAVLQARLRVKPKVRIEPIDKVVRKMTEDGGRKPRKFFDYR